MNTITPTNFHNIIKAKFDENGQTDFKAFTQTLEGTSFVIDSCIFEQLVSYLEGNTTNANTTNNIISHINSTNNNTSFLTSLLLCKLIQSKLTYTYNNTVPSIENNKDLISTYLTLYSKITETEQLTNLLTAETITSSGVLNLLQNNPSLMLNIICETNKYLEPVMLEFDELFDNSTNFNQINWTEFHEKILNFNAYTISTNATNADYLLTFCYDIGVKYITKQVISNIASVSNCDDIIDSIDHKLFISNILLILIVKAINNEQTNPYRLHYLIYAYLCNFKSQSSFDNAGICIVLSMIYAKNGLTRFNEKYITNLKELRKYYINQFIPIIQKCPLIEINQFDDEEYINTMEHELMQNNPFYQMIFNRYDTFTTDFRDGLDRKEAILYFLKREKSFYRFLREQFKSIPNKFREKYNEMHDVIVNLGFLTPFRLKNELFNQYHALFNSCTNNPDLNTCFYNDTITTYYAKNRKITPIIFYMHLLQEMREYNQAHNSKLFKIRLFNQYTSTHEILEKFIKISNLHEQQNNTIIKLDDDTGISFDNELLDVIKHVLIKTDDEIYKVRMFKLCADIIASFIAEEYIRKDNGKNKLSILTIIQYDEGPHATCRIIENNEAFIYDPNLKVRNIQLFGFMYIEAGYLSIISRLANLDELEEPDDIDYENIETIDTEIYNINYPRLVRFLGGNKDKLIRLLVWIICGIILILFVVIVVKYIKNSKYNCSMNNMNNY